MNPERETIKQVLIDCDYPKAQIEQVTDKLLAMDPILLTAFKEWMVTNQFPQEPKFNGFTPWNVKATFQKLKAPAVFLLLDWLRREPEEALQALKQDYGRDTPVLYL